MRKWTQVFLVCSASLAMRNGESTKRARTQSFGSEGERRKIDAMAADSRDGGVEPEDRSSGSQTPTRRTASHLCWCLFLAVGLVLCVSAREAKTNTAHSTFLVRVGEPCADFFWMLRWQYYFCRFLHVKSPSSPAQP